ncbi:hypothetical protein [Halorientalis regularis]|uniref:Uncharacterized protein n=1 Tax=Halorientalis regularis TaxID=660518 RepID=A0A1G7LWX4_9EURY|nr:hypothetical protein [Halorientalis regularis]SDF54007.1 hypothetical protein SAMN05216218_10756 [Halorientalis regularis]
MIDLTIYDSQGQPLDDPGAPKNERIANFFFDGVRLAIESIDSVRAYCFFRARESEGARLDQFYAEFEASSVGEIENLKSDVEEKVTREYDMILESSTEDSTVFDLIPEASRLTPPGDRKTRDLIPKLISRGERPQFGVSNYREALALLLDVLRNSRANKVAIADNAESSELSSYDIVIETGDHTGLVPLGDTEAALSRERRSNMRSEQGGLAGGAQGGNDSRYQSPLGGDSTGDDLTRKDKLLSIGLISAFGIAVLALLVGGALYGACFLGVSVDLPVVGDLCGSDSGNQSEFDVSAYSVTAYDANSTISIRWNGSSDVKHTVRLFNNSGIQIGENHTVDSSPATKSWTDLESGDYRINVTNSSGARKMVWNGTLNATEVQSSGSQSNGTQSTVTPTNDSSSNTRGTNSTETDENTSTEAEIVSLPTGE